MNPVTTLVWFRRDLRLADHPALAAAVRAGAVVPVYVWDPGAEEPWAPGGASRWWLARSLEALDADLRRARSRLLVRRGRAESEIVRLARETGARRVHWSRLYEPSADRRDEDVRRALESQGVEVETFNSSLLHEPRTIRTRQGGPYGVFTPFHRACLAAPEPPAALPSPERLVSPARLPRGLGIDELGLESRPDWAGGLRREWEPGETGARNRLERFLREAFDDYETDRDRPDRAGTSALSPHLHFGEISPAALLRAVRSREAVRTRGGASPSAEKYVSELHWREFAYHLLHHHPDTPHRPLRRRPFERMPWRRDARALEAWRQGRTGYPFVDAGMRQLWATGWMHNRARMVAASFLVKQLLISWTEGARWFWDTLVDADQACNTLGWQWVAGCGADAAPFFRIFNPVIQSQKFDPDGAYIRRWVPELSRLAAPWIHRPWEAPRGILEEAGVRPGKTYPLPIVEHAEGRARALAAHAKASSLT